MITFGMLTLSLCLYTTPPVYAKHATFGFNKNIFLNCSEQHHISIGNVTVHQFDTSCPRSSCNVTSIKDTIKTHCNDRSVCELSSDKIAECLIDTGHFNLKYTCKEKPFSCNFENGLCGFTVEPISYSGYLWKKTSWGSSTYGTGPTTDHTTLHSSNYIFADASDGSKNDRTRLVSKLIRPSRNQCLSFWYHMFGTHVNTLNIYQRYDNLSQKLIGNLSYDHENMWHNKMINLNTNADTFKIVFEAIRGNSYTGDIALDDIVIINRKCGVSEYDCNFETDCSWTSNTENGWRVKEKNGFVSGYVMKDATTGSSLGKLMFMQKNRKANLSSQVIRSTEKYCFTFAYYIYGGDNVKLVIFIDTELTSKHIWRSSHNNYRGWLRGSKDIFMKNNFTIIIEGTGNKDWGVVAIDDLSLAIGTCAGLTIHSQTCSSVRQSHADMFPECPVYYTDFNAYDLSFTPSFKECDDIYEDLEKASLTKCKNSISNHCTFDFTEAVQTRPLCFQTNTVKLDYTCEDVAGESQFEKVQNIEVLGVGIGSALLCLFLICFLICKIKRCRLSKTKNTTADNMHTNNYVMTQSVAFAVDSKPRSDARQTTKIISPYSSNDNGTENDFPHQHNFNPRSDIRKYDQNMYTLVDKPKTNISQSRHINETDKESNHVVADFAYQYELASSISMKTGDNDERNGGSIATDDFYDIFNQIQLHNETADNVYSHTVDNVYDTTYRDSKKSEDDNYDHFNGSSLR